jgi:hypothetical protein
MGIDDVLEPRIRMAARSRAFERRILGELVDARLTRERGGWAPSWRLRRCFARWRSRAMVEPCLPGLAVPGVTLAPLAVLAQG